MPESFDHLKAQKDAIVAREQALYKKALQQLEATANGIWKNQQMSTQAVASALLDLIVKFVDEQTYSQEADAKSQEVNQQ